MSTHRVFHALGPPVLALIATALLIAALALFGAGCDAGIARPATWSEAVYTWSDAWCEDTYRCAPEYFAAHYTGHAVCRFTESAVLCARGDIECDDPYPDAQVAALEDCINEMYTWPCGEWLPPFSCIAALDPGAP
jgi:hypothetical protein